MKPTRLLTWLVLLGLGGLGLRGAEPLIIDVAFTYGKIDYVDLGSARVCNARLNHPETKNLKSFALTYRAWAPFGDFVHVSGFYFELNEYELQGRRQTVTMGRIQKYPDLVKRYNAVRPVSVNAVFSLDLLADAFPLTKVGYFKVTDDQLVYGFSRSGERHDSSTIAFPWTKAFSLDARSFTPQDDTQEDDLRKIMTGLRRVDDREQAWSNLTLKIEWPDEVIDAIGDLYEKYEKEGKKLDDDYKYLKDPPKESPYAGDPAWAKPVDPQLKSGEGVMEKNASVIRAGGREVFRSTDHWGISPLNERKTHFGMRRNDNRLMEIYDTRGKRVALGGYDRFIAVGKDQAGRLQLMGVPASPSSALHTRNEYVVLPSTLTEKGMADLRRRDSGQQESQISDDAKPGLYIVASTQRYEYFTGELLTLDEKMKIVRREPGYFQK